MARVLAGGRQSCVKTHCFRGPQLGWSHHQAGEYNAISLGSVGPALLIAFEQALRFAYNEEERFKPIAEATCGIVSHLLLGRFRRC